MKRILFTFFLILFAWPSAADEDFSNADLLRNFDVIAFGNEYTGRKHARLQIITLAELFQNKRPDIPWVDTSAQRKAKREETGKQGKLI